MGHTIVLPPTIATTTAAVVVHRRPFALRQVVAPQVVEPRARACCCLANCCRNESSIQPQLLLRPREDRPAQSWGVDGGSAGAPVPEENLVG